MKQGNLGSDGGEEGSLHSGRGGNRRKRPSALCLSEVCVSHSECACGIDLINVKQLNLGKEKKSSAKGKQKNMVD